MACKLDSALLLRPIYEIILFTIRIGTSPHCRNPCPECQGSPNLETVNPIVSRQSVLCALPRRAVCPAP